MKLLARMGRAYRCLATGFCFLVFMCGGVVITGLIFPLLRLLPMDRTRKERWSLLLVTWCFRTFTGMMRGVGVIASIRVEGLEQIERGKPHVYIANHPTLIDVVLMMGILRDCNCIVKEALFRHPFMGGVARGSGLIPNAGGPALLEEVERQFRMGRSLMIFPEGTRSPKGGLNPFNRGAARLVLHTGIPVVPVTLTCEPITLMKGQPWYDVPARAVDICLRFHGIMTIPEEVLAHELQPRKVRALNRHFEGFFKRELGIGD